MEGRERIGMSPTRVLLEEPSGGGGTKLEEGGVRKKKGEKKERERGKWRGVRLPWGGLG